MNELSVELVDRVLAKLNVERPANPDLSSLRQLYAAWCLQMPFDNIRKMIALRSGEQKALPGLDAHDFFEHWLLHGTGATCWPVANALYELLRALGYDAHRIAGCMRDMGVVNHGSVKVVIEEKEWLAEASLLLNVILPLSHETIMHDDPVFPSELERDVNTHLLWLKTPPNEDHFACRLSTDPLPISVFEERYEASRSTSVFNQRVYAKRNYPGKMIVLFGNSLYTKTTEGLDHRELTREELCEELHIEIGISESLINEWAASGNLDASMEKISRKHPPVAVMKPPSLRVL